MLIFFFSVRRYRSCDVHRNEPQKRRNGEERNGSVHQDRSNTRRIAENVRQAFRRNGLPNQQGMLQMFYQLTSLFR